MKRKIVDGCSGIACLALALGILALAATPAAAEARPANLTLAQGAGMDAEPDASVRGLQRILQSRGYALGPAGVDGRFGPVTETAVRRFQRSFGLVPDGIVGAKTRKLLRTLCRTGLCPSRDEARGPAGRSQGRPTPAAARGRQHAAPTQGFEWSAWATVAAALLGLLLVASLYSWRSGRSGGRSQSKPSRRVVGYVAAGRGAAEAHRATVQEKAIMEECERRGWALHDVFCEVAGGEREALAYALEFIASGQATCLMVSDLDTIGGTTAEVGRLFEWLGRVPAELVALEPEIDTSTREGALAAQVVLGLSRRDAELWALRARHGLGDVQSPAWGWEGSVN
jgi:peptidoglycan hydrolase-like protein with peptidoglycan-binding domain